MPKYKVLSGIPSMGPYPEQFPRGRGSHRVGLVVEFETNDGAHWVGNFQGGLNSFTAIYDHPNGAYIVVVSEGQCYIVNPESREADLLSSQIVDIIEVPSLSLLLLQDPSTFTALSRVGILWETKRISWDGFRKIRIDDEQLLGEAFIPFGDPWRPFILDLLSGKVVSGSYLIEQEQIKTNPWWKFW